MAKSTAANASYTIRQAGSAGTINSIVNWSPDVAVPAAAKSAAASALFVKCLKTGMLTVSSSAAAPEFNYVGSHVVTLDPFAADQSDTNFDLLEQLQIPAQAPDFDQINLNQKLYANVGDKVYGFVLNSTDLATIALSCVINNYYIIKSLAGTDVIFFTGTSTINEDPGANTPVRIITENATMFFQNILIEGNTPIVPPQNC